MNAILCLFIYMGKTSSAGEIISVLKLIIRKIRNRFSEVFIFFRADSYHSKPEVHGWCEGKELNLL